MHIRRSTVAALAGLTGATLGVAAAVAGYAINTVHRPGREEPLYAFSPFEVGAPADDISFRGEDGLRLAGWWLDHPDSQWVVICAHGHQGSKADMLGIGPGLWRRGHSVLLFDFRGCGESELGPRSLAHHEQRDLRAAIDYATARRPDARIALVGFSMGAATSILVGADDPRVDLFVLDSPFAEMRDVLSYAFRSRRLPTVPVMGLIELGTRAGQGYGMHQVRPIDVVSRLAPRPVLIMHGDQDRIIPYEHLDRLAKAAGPQVQVHTFEGAGHCWGYFADRPGYINLVAAFIEAG